LPVPTIGGRRRVIGTGNPKARVTVRLTAGNPRPNLQNKKGAAFKRQPPFF